MKKRLTSFVAVIVLVVFCLYLVPHEVVHVFYDHKDTVHTQHDAADSKTLSSVHIHCDFLCNYVSEFLPGTEPVRAECSTTLQVHFAVVAVQTVRCIAVLRDSRGPPLS